MSLRERLAAGEAVDFDVYDMHAHIGRYSHGIPSLDPATIVDVMDRLGVRSTVVSHLQCISWDVHWGNDRVHEAMLAHPGRILGYASMFPRSRSFVKEEAELRAEQGFAGFKFHNGNGFAYDETDYAPAWAVADRHRMPILFHTWGSEDVMRQIGKVAEMAPGAFILLGHSTSSNYDLYIRMAEKYPNVFLELCGSLAALGSIEYLVSHAGAEKVIWGSDCDFYSMAQQFGRIMGCRCTDDEKRRMMSLNAAAILNARI